MAFSYHIEPLLSVDFNNSILSKSGKGSFSNLSIILVTLSIVTKNKSVIGLIIAKLSYFGDIIVLSAQVTPYLPFSFKTVYSERLTFLLYKVVKILTILYFYLFYIQFYYLSYP